MPLPHRDIPGSLWLPDVGRGVLSPELEGFFWHHLEAATNSRKDTEVVFYCLSDCWMSWNKVYWYRDGTDGWEAAKLPMEEREPVLGP